MSESTPMLRQIKPEPMWDQAYHQLRDALFAGHYQPGSVMALRTLADALGTSITPVRDAVSRLIAQGALKPGPRNSALVPDIDASALNDLTKVRCHLEGLAAREAALRSDPVGIERLESSLKHMREMIRKRELDTYLSEHRDFHFQVYAMAGNPLLQEVIDNLWLRCGPVLSFVVPEYVQLLKGTDHHIAIVSAIKSRDFRTAQQEVVADIEEAAAYLLSLADAQGNIRRKQE